MNIMLKRLILFNILLLFISCTAPGGNENTTVSIKTTLGEIKVRLYDGTPIHRDNFIKLVRSGFYDGISFHRVIEDFMIQGGDPSTKTGGNAEMPDSMSTYSIPAEFRTEYFHKKGALAAAREPDDINPEMRSSGTQFYIVQGIKYNDDELNKIEQKLNSNIKQSLFNKFLGEAADSIMGADNSASSAEIQEIASIRMFNYLTSHKDFKVPEDHRQVYKTTGGVPRLDGTYTVFGEVIEGLEVVDKIAAVQTDSADKPVTDVKIIKMKIIRN